MPEATRGINIEGLAAAAIGERNEKPVIVGLVRPHGQVDLNEKLKGDSARSSKTFEMTNGERLLVKLLKEKLPKKPGLLAIAANDPKNGPQIRILPIEQTGLGGFYGLIEPPKPKVVILGRWKM